MKKIIAFLLLFLNGCALSIGGSTQKDTPVDHCIDVCESHTFSSDLARCLESCKSLSCKSK